MPIYEDNASAEGKTYYRMKQGRFFLKNEDLGSVFEGVYRGHDLRFDPGTNDIEANDQLRIFLSDVNEAGEEYTPVLTVNHASTCGWMFAQQLRTIRRDDRIRIKLAQGTQKAKITFCNVDIYDAEKGVWNAAPKTPFPEDRNARIAQGRKEIMDHPDFQGYIQNSPKQPSSNKPKTVEI